VTPLAERFLCIHCHFYQPPRENPWLESVEVQDSASPYHDWNERITTECYAPNSLSRILDKEGRIKEIVNNYEKVSFNFGPTLLSWLEGHSPPTYEAIIEADRLSVKARGGHGNAISQAYNHMILPLANRKDKETQILWGVRDFTRRFGRHPEGMWLPETAVDIESLEIISGMGIKFTILSPHQAKRTRQIGSSKWQDRIDTTMPYLLALPSGRKISVFFYDADVSKAVAFERLLDSGEDFAKRLLGKFSKTPERPQLVHIATDGESYGHHHTFGDMALSYCLNYIETKGLARITNYGEYLEKYPPTHEAEIIENTSWSCAHGVARWRSDCGDSTGGKPGWNQKWRKPLREALDALRDGLSVEYEKAARESLKEPWLARDDYIDVILGRSDEALDAFLKKHSKWDADAVRILKLLELQRHCMLMYTSCGWFFSDISGIETVQILQYAGRAVQLAEELFGDGTERRFLEKLKEAKSNIPSKATGVDIYGDSVKEEMVDLNKVGAHYAVSSLFEDYGDVTSIHCYKVKQEDYQRTESPEAELVIGRIEVSSIITRDSGRLGFGVLRLGNHDINCAICRFEGDDEYAAMKGELLSAFEKGAFSEVIRLLSAHFGECTYTLGDLFRDEQRKIITLITASTLEGFEESYRRMYEGSKFFMGMLREGGMPLPRSFLGAAEFALMTELKRAVQDNGANVKKIESLYNELKNWSLNPPPELEFIIRRRLEHRMEELPDNPSERLLAEIGQLLSFSYKASVGVNLWRVQNIYYRMSKTIYVELLRKAGEGDADSKGFVESFRHLGQMLFFNVEAILK
jgi:alpha-amylase/alpha-mannosidase (GH57 family)